MDEKIPRKAWGMLAVIYFASFCAPLAQFKTPPLALDIFAAFGITGSQFGGLMAVIGIAGLILAFPTAYIVRGIGPKRTILLAMVFLIVGSFGGCFVSSFGPLMVTRLFEGIGLGLVGVVAPSCVTVWFPPAKRGMALGIWATWVPVAMVIIFAIAPTMSAHLGWKSVFILCGVLSVIALILNAIFFEMPDTEEADFSQGSFKDTLSSYKNKNIWFLGIIMMAFMFIGTGALVNYYQSYLQIIHGWDATPAALMISLYTAIGAVLSIIGGFMSDKITPHPNSKRWLIVLTFVVYGIGLLIAFPTPGGHSTVMIVLGIIIFGLAAGLGSGTIRPLAPIVGGGGAMGAAAGMAMIQFMQNLGVAIGSPIYSGVFAAGAGTDIATAPGAISAAVLNHSWYMTTLEVLIPLCIISIVLAIFLIPVKKAKKQ